MLACGRQDGCIIFFAAETGVLLAYQGPKSWQSTPPAEAGPTPVTLYKPHETPVLSAQLVGTYFVSSELDMPLVSTYLVWNRLGLAQDGQHVVVLHKAHSAADGGELGPPYTPDP